MRIMVLHVGDIHLKGDGNPVLGREEAIVAAVRSTGYEVDRLLIVIAGDLAYSGQDLEYDLAMQFIKSIEDRLEEVFSLAAGDVATLVVPGNHDCDFASEGAARNLLIKAILQGEASVSDADVVHLCLEVQSSFRACRDLLMEGLDLKQMGKLPLDIAFYVDLWGSVRLLAMNTAWLSQLNESPGELFMPPIIWPDGERVEVTIAVFHHPYNWLHPRSSRNFRSEVESIADIALSGHEHENSRRLISAEGGLRSTHIEGGALQVREDASMSAFNVIILDTEGARNKFAQFVWRGTRYELGEGSLRGRDGSVLRWEPYQLNRARTRGKVALREDFERVLEEPGLTLIGAEHSIHLADIFVSPDLMELPVYGDPRKPGRLIPAERIFDSLLARERVLVTADDQAGKTALAHRLFLECVQRGFYPVLIGGEDRLPRGDTLFGYLEKKFEEQYVSPDRTHFSQADRSSRVVIFDDFHRTKTSRRSRSDILVRMGMFAGRFYLFAHDLDNVVEEILRGESREDFDYLQILPLGFLRRHDFVERWFERHGEGVDPPEVFARRVVQATKTLDAVVGRNLVPAYPIYLIAILRALDEGVGVDLSVGSHGYYYELLIKTALARRRSSREYDLLINCLTWFAYKLYSEKRDWLARESAIAWLGEYAAEFDLEINAEKVVRKMTRDGLFSLRNGELSFKYPYIRYFFVARYFAENIAVDAVRMQVRGLASEVSDEEVANTLLFLAHLSRDELILETILSVASGRFAGQALCSLEEKELEFLGEVRELTGIVFEDKGAREYRRQLAAQRDEEDEDEVTPIEREVEEERREARKEFAASIRSLQIVGEVLKSFPATLKSDTKLDMARACYSLGRRVTGAVLAMLEKSRELLVRDIVDAANIEELELMQEEVVAEVENVLLWLARAASFGVIKKVSGAIGAPELQRTYDRLIEEDRCIMTELMDLSIRLEQAGSVPGNRIKELAQSWVKKPFGKSLLQLLVLSHLYMFDVDYRTKQQVCEALGVEYRPVQIRSSNPRRLKASGKARRGKEPSIAKEE